MATLTGLLSPLVIACLTFGGSSHRLVQTNKAHHASFAEYTRLFHRTYMEGSEEWKERRALFEERKAAVLLQNSKPDRLWTAALNHLSDRTENELGRMRGWSRVADGPGAPGTVAAARGPAAFLAESVKRTEHLPPSVDWGNLGGVQQIREQGGCGGCWAVAAASMMEARYELKYQKNRTFSAQQFVNCVPNPKSCGGDGGCRGATVELAMEYAQKKGVRSAEEEPYVGMDGKCVEKASLLSGGDDNNDAGAEFGMVGWAKLPENKAQPLMEAVLEGPVAISLAAADVASYSSGIFDGCSRDAVLDHAVLLLGYGEEAGTKYWSIQNSWGPLWGENGRFRVLRQNTPAADDEYCGDDNRPGEGTACKPYPKKVRVCGMCGLLYDSVVIHFGDQQAAEGAKQLSAIGLRGAGV